MQACLAQRKLEAVVRLAALAPLAKPDGSSAAGRGVAERRAVLLRAAGAGRLCSREAFSPFVFSWLQEASYSLLQPVTASYSPLQPLTVPYSPLQPLTARCSLLQPVAASYSPLQPLTAS